VKAFLLAAGLGTRLRPLTDTVPKALVPVHGVPMLDRLASALVRGGVTSFALNMHHLPEEVEHHLASRDGAGRFTASPHIPVHLLHEPRLLGTGGGLLNAASYWGVAPMLVWNADILADLDPQRLMAAHLTHPDALALLAVSGRTASSTLLFDAEGTLCGIASARRNDHRVVRTASGPVQPRAFHGISVLSPRLRAHMTRHHMSGDAFDLIDVLLDAAARDGLVRAFDAGDSFWGSTGTPQELALLERGLTERPELLARWSPATLH
jgi:N-acetyl-alpha-D-muramate 1-phosphate uridylyltransferase